MRKMATALLTLLIALPSFAYTLAPPPEKGSAAYKEDFRILHVYQNERTEEECEAADLQSRPTIESMFGPDTGILTAKEIDSVKSEGNKLLRKVFTIAEPFKEQYHRTRPYNADPTLHPCVQIPGGNKAYPSGHTAAGYVLSYWLAKQFPSKKDRILKQGIQVGVNRLIGGVHHPSDVAAGRALGKQIVEDLADLD